MAIPSDSFAPEDVAGLTLGALEDFRPGQLGRIPADAFQEFKPPQLEALQPETVGALQRTQLRALQPETVDALQPAQIEAITAEQAAELGLPPHLNPGTVATDEDQEAMSQEALPSDTEEEEVTSISPDPGAPPPPLDLDTATPEEMLEFEAAMLAYEAAQDAMSQEALSSDTEEAAQDELSEAVSNAVDTNYEQSNDVGLTDYQVSVINQAAELPTSAEEIVEALPEPTPSAAPEPGTPLPPGDPGITPEEGSPI